MSNDHIDDKLNKILAIIENMLSQKPHFSLGEAAKYLCISKSTLYKHTSAGDIPYHKPNGKLITFKKKDLDEWLEQYRIPSNRELRNDFSTDKPEN